jgi:hypothetical protein
MNAAAQLADVWDALADVVQVNPVLAAAWWLCAVVLAGILLYTWRRLFNSRL